jgi:plastocyanin
MSTIRTAGASWVAAIGLLTVGCGGGEKPGAQPAADTTTAAAPAPPPAGGAGASHTVLMDFDGTNYKFIPDALTIKAGDRVVFTNKAGGPHNVQFFADSIPQESRATLDAAMPGDKLGELNGPLLVAEGETYEVSFAGVVPGAYPLTCTPHQAMNMNMRITVQP